MDVQRSGVVKAEEWNTWDKAILEARKRRKRNLPSKATTGKKEIGGSQIRPWEPGINTERIPGRCSCTWNLQGGKWWLKFRHQACLAREEHG